MKLRTGGVHIRITSCISILALLAVAMVTGPSAVKEIRHHIYGATTRAQNNVTQLTVRYLPGVSSVDQEGNPNGTSVIDGVTFTFGNTFPNNIVALNFTPAITIADAHTMAGIMRTTGLFDVVDVMVPLRPTITGTQWPTCASTICDVKQDWYLDAMGARTVWTDSAANSVYPTVAVIDSGILAHPDIDGNTLPGYDFVGRSSVYVPVWGRNVDVDGLTSGGDGDGYDANPLDQGQGRTLGQCHLPLFQLFEQRYTNAPAADSSWHGTGVASIIAAEADNNEGIKGVAPKAKILPLRVLGRCVETDDSANLANAIRWAAGLSVTDPENGNVLPLNTNKAHVINLSLGADQEINDYCPSVYQDAITAAINAGVSVVASAGNDSDSAIPRYVDARRNSPSNCAGVISVGATKPNGTTAWYTNINADIVAPGGDTRTAYEDGILVASSTETGPYTTPSYQYKFGQGTSYASPMVAGAIAMAKAKYHSTSDLARLTPFAIKQAVLQAASINGTPCTGCGHGLLTIPNLLTTLDPTTEPTTPQNVVRTGGPYSSTTGLVQWDAPASNIWNPVTAYTVRAYTAPTGGSVAASCTPADLVDLYCLLTGLATDTTYYVSVTATTVGSTTSARAALTTISRAAAPTGLVATPGPGKATLSWNSVTDFGSFYFIGLYEGLIYTSETGGASIGSCYVNSPNTCDFENLTPGVTYWMEVTAMTGSQDGSFVPARVRVVPTALPVVVTTPPAVAAPPAVTTPPASNNSNTNSGSNTSTNTSPSLSNSPVSASPAPVVYKPQALVAVTSLAKTAGIAIPAGAKTSISVASSLKKICVISAGKVKMVGAGTCKVSLTVTPKKGKAVKKTVSVKISK